MSTLSPDLQTGERLIVLHNISPGEEGQRIVHISYDISCQYRRNLELAALEASWHGESVENFWSEARSRLESEEYLTIQEIKAWLGVRRVEVELGQERPLEDVSLDLVLERRWVRTFLHTLYLVVHLSDL
ncbi:hypothetical protein B0H14DRAFT_3460998 [Mycena olivaceomarginata]|nr:hypothetical protein B0H14DRAFT_3460998 [Mycena olivaceomarginata]